jgi:YVTN family beta-propeller protein
MMGFKAMFRFACFLFLLASAAANAETPMLLVLLKGANALGYYTMEGKLVATVPVGEHPHEMVLTPDGKTLYITDNGTMRIEHAGKGGNTISIVDVHARKRVGRINLEKNYRPHGIDYHDTTKRIAVTTENPDRLLIVEAEDKRILRSFDTKGKTPHMVSFGPYNTGPQWTFVSNSGSASVAAIQSTTGEVKLIPTGERPEGSVLSKDGSQLYVTNRESASITVIDTGRQAAVSEIKTGKGPVRIGITPDGRYLVYALMHERKIEITDLETRRPVAQIGVEGQPVSLTVSRDGKYAFASSEEIDTVHIISLEERKLVRSFQTAKGAAPDPVILVNLP